MRYQTASGYTVEKDGNARRIYNKAGKFLGMILDRGPIDHAPTSVYGGGGGHLTSTEVHDIVGPNGGMLVKGCITGTLWQHVKEELGEA